MKKKILSVIGFMFVGISAYFVSLYFTFPYNSFTPFISYHVKKTTGADIGISSIKPIFPLGVMFNNVSVKDDQFSYFLNRIEGRFSLESLFSFEPEFELKIIKKKSTIKSNSRLIGGNLVTNIKLTTSSLESLIPSNPNFNLLGGANIDGKVTIPIGDDFFDGDWSIDMIKDGVFSFKMKAGRIDLKSLPLPGLDKIKYKNISGKISISGKKIVFEKCNIFGPIQGQVKGVIKLKNPINKSRIDLKVKFKLSKSIINDIGPLISFISNKKGRDGFYQIDIKGSFDRIRPII